MNETLFSKNNLQFYFILLLSAVCYFILAYQTTRQNFLQAGVIFAILFVLYFISCRFLSVYFFKHLLLAGILFRLLLLFSIPNLSDDVYRFIWDGRVAANGINPFSFPPSEIMQGAPIRGLTYALYERLNSPGYYSVYPPVLQAFFWMAAKFFPVNVQGAIIFMKGLVLLAEVGTIALLVQILEKMSLPKEASLLYVLNPMVIIELTGNAHFDGLMVCCLLLAFFLLLKNNFKTSAIFLGAGIAAKLIPFLFIPLIVQKLGWKKGLCYLLIAGITTSVLFAVVFDKMTIMNMIGSADMFIRKFEFNASVYYLFRWIGTLITGYNPIALTGPLLYLTAASLILYLSFSGKIKSDTHFFTRALFIITAWYLLATTVHPWYLCLPVAISVFTPFRYALLWSFTALLSYMAYHFVPVKENLWLTGAGYILVAGYALWEMKRESKKVVIIEADP